ncbi:MAG: hypothetical protein HC805_02650 [Alkalinema sp. RL_2_19]|nr:hypothetical protein [Alkalinema sp. RL_2_19]
MNKFSRLFEDRQIAAPAKAPVAGSEALAKRIDAANQPPTDSAPTAPAQDRAAVPGPIKLKPKRKTKAKAKSKSQPKSHPPRKRGRPANGKRSDPEWYGRTFYIRKQTDERLEDALTKLRRSGIEFDKSQLVDALLNAWASVELEQISDFQIGEILEKPEA